MDGEDLAGLYGETRAAAAALRAKSAEIHELAERLELLTKDTTAWYAGTRARVEARATLEHAEELRRVLAEMDERLGE
jgi:hypothetical protein